MSAQSDRKFSTLAIHAGESPDPTTNAHITPIYQTTTFAFNSTAEFDEVANSPDGFVYSRMGNPTVAALEKKLAILEESEACLVTSSGMAAVFPSF